MSRDNLRLRTDSCKDEISTTETENVDDSQSVSEVANTQTRKPHRWRAHRQDRCRDVYEWPIRMTILLASDERR